MGGFREGDPKSHQVLHQGRVNFHLAGQGFCEERGGDGRVGAERVAQGGAGEFADALAECGEERHGEWTRGDAGRGPWRHGDLPARDREAVRGGGAVELCMPKLSARSTVARALVPAASTLVPTLGGLLDNFMNRRAFLGVSCAEAAAMPASRHSQLSVR